MAYQDAIMRKAAKLTSDPRRDPPRQSQDFDTPRVDTETNRKDFNKPQQAEPIRSSEPDVILKYPQDENYLAYMLFRVKKINPWDIDVQQAKKILDTPALTGEKARYKPILDLAKSLGDDTSSQENQAAADEASGAGQASYGKSRPDNYAIGKSGEFSADAAAGSAASSAARNAAKDANNNGGYQDSRIKNMPTWDVPSGSPRNPAEANTPPAVT